MDPRRTTSGRRMLGASLASVLIGLSANAVAQEPARDDGIRIIEGPTAFPAPETPAPPKGRTRLPPGSVEPSAGDPGFEDLVQNAIDAERKKYPGPSGGRLPPSAWKVGPPGIDVNETAPAEPVPAEGIVVAPEAPAPVPVEPPATAKAPEPRRTPEAPEAAETPEPRQATRPPVVSVPAAEPAPAEAPVARVPPPKPYVPPVVAKPKVRKPAREPDRVVPDAPREPEPLAPEPDAVVAEPVPQDDSGRDEADEPITGIILSDVTIRSEPYKTSAAVGTARAGTTVDVVECTGWCEIRVGALRGWIYGSFIDLPEATTPGGR